MRSFIVLPFLAFVLVVAAAFVSICGSTVYSAAAAVAMVIAAGRIAVLLPLVGGPDYVEGVRLLHWRRRDREK